ncbi:MAG: histidine kinase [Novosphingobium pentaromativorans]|uniref:Histidine kinase n=1 Tax=Novosphingobium pentaromativorans TaxID=205844 RepID=A0A2W5N9Y1_9SPHN|nr:MAG: histidine kinase [Novosphingobium pentaromativorans]
MNDMVLIVEDELFVVLDLEDLVAEEGLGISAHCGTVAATMRTLDRERPQLAILDVRLPDGEVFPAADRLQEMEIPIIFHSGHANESDLRSRYPDAQICAKPSSPSRLRSAMRKAMAGNS